MTRMLNWGAHPPRVLVSAPSPKRSFPLTTNPAAAGRTDWCRGGRRGDRECFRSACADTRRYKDSLTADYADETDWGSAPALSAGFGALAETFFP
jgi:hypothetical protein